MEKKIQIQIFGAWDWVLGGGCSSGGCGGCSSKSKEGSASGCGGCSSGGEGGCSSKTPKQMGELYEELLQFLQGSDVKERVELEFLDIRKVNVLDYDDIRVLFDRGYELPYCVIDGIVRYYGGISNDLIYKDIKELLET